MRSGTSAAIKSGGNDPETCLFAIRSLQSQRLLPARARVFQNGIASLSIAAARLESLSLVSGFMFAVLRPWIVMKALSVQGWQPQIDDDIRIPDSGTLENLVFRPFPEEDFDAKFRTLSKKRSQRPLSERLQNDRHLGVLRGNSLFRVNQGCGSKVHCQILSIIYAQSTN